MDLSPSQVSSATFRTVRKGYDPEEVDSFLQHVATALEQCQQQAAAMEGRARVAVARLQELNAASAADTSGAALPAPGDGAPAGEAVNVQPDEAATISRTLLLAQRTADTAIAEAEAEAERIRTGARAEADTTLDSTREMAAKLVEDARTEARQVSEAERRTVEAELAALLARRGSLTGDVDQIEAFLVDQRERLRSAARQIEALCDRVPEGLGELRPPVLSEPVDTAVPVSGGPRPGDDTAELRLPPEATGPFASVSELAASLEADGLPHVVGSDNGSPTVEPGHAPELPHRHGDNGTNGTAG